MTTNGNIKDILSSLGYRLRDDGKCWRCSAVYRGGKNENSISIIKNSLLWSDFGAGISSRPISELLAKHNIGADNPVVINPQEPMVDEIDEPQIEKIYPDSILKNLLPHYKFYIDRGVNIQSLSRLRSGMATTGKMYQRYVFPIYNSDCKIIGFSGRYMGANQSRPKWKHLGKKKNWVYPLNVKDENGVFFAREAIKKTEEVIIVESIGDLLALHSHNIFNVVVSFGLKISPAVICAILELNPLKIFLCLNDDSSKPELENNGKNACIENFLILLKYFDYENIGICLPVKNDFGDMNDCDFKKWVEKKESTDYDEQRDYICEMATKLRQNKKISEKSYKNMELLGCG